ncbi:MAG: hypothetical protein ACE5JG_10310 [Planctomycetota bacterium]
MRSLALLVAAGIVFLLSMLVPHHQGAVRVRLETQALERLLEAAARPGGRDEWEEAGYRFRWVRGDELPDLLVAEPRSPPEGGVRIFATRPDGTVYELDPVTGTSAAGRDPVLRLRRILALPPGRRREHLRRSPWVPLGG